MIRHSEITQHELRDQIKKQLLRIAGNKNLGIYGSLNCGSGKRMKKENRVFFKDVKDAQLHGFRPCGHCMRSAYKDWKDGVI